MTKAQEAEKGRGLDPGADDYLTTPYRRPEMRARVRTLEEVVWHYNVGGAASGAGQFDTSPARAVQLKALGLRPVLVGRDATVLAKLQAMGVANPESYEIHNSVASPLVAAMVDRLDVRLQRRG